jgi:hypothetical protein
MAGRDRQLPPPRTLRGRVVFLIGAAAVTAVALTAPMVSSLPTATAAALLPAAARVAAISDLAGPLLPPAGPVGSPTPSPTPTAQTPVALAPVVPVGTPRGNDISWTQCSVALGGYANPMPDDGVSFVVIGLSQGEGFTTNACLSDQVAWTRARHVRVAGYVFPSYPTNVEYAAYGGKGPYPSGTAAGRLSNVGYQEAAYWLKAAKVAGLSTPMIWVDVEKKLRGHPWSTRTDRNLLVIRGLLAGFAHAGMRTGIYSPGSHWAEITGGVRLGQVEWRTVGGRTPAEALATCTKPGVQGSPVLMAQFWNATGTVDNDVLCPITRGTYLTRYFRQF